MLAGSIAPTVGEANCWRAKKKDRLKRPFENGLFSIQDENR